MNLQEMTNEQLIDELKMHVSGYLYHFIIPEIKSRLNAPKQPYEVRYKFLPTDRDIDDMKPVKVL